MQPGGLAALEPHEDGSSFSFVLALNDEAEYTGGGPSHGRHCQICGACGLLWVMWVVDCDSTAHLTAANGSSGGTRFVNLAERPIFRPSIGKATLFSGKNRHCGEATTGGTRYILAGFLKYRGPECDVRDATVACCFAQSL